MTVTKHEVAYIINLPDCDPQITHVLLEDGYTTRDDIPKMIGIRRGVSADLVRVLAVQDAD